MIELFDEYYIIIDEYNYALCKGEPKKQIRKDGKVLIKHNVKGYYGSLTKALKAFRQELYRDGLKDGISDLVQACTTITEINTRVDKLLEELEA